MSASDSWLLGHKACTQEEAMGRYGDIANQKVYIARYLHAV